MNDIPLRVKIISIILGLLGVISFIFSAFLISTGASDSFEGLSGLYLLYGGPLLLISIFLLVSSRSLRKGKNWARITASVVFLLFTSLVVIVSFFGFDNLPITIMFLIIFLIIFYYLMFDRKTKEFFNPQLN